MENGRRRKNKKMQLSSSRRETTPENRCSPKKSIGCMSGILHILSRHNSRLRIPSARKDQKIETSPKTSTPAPPPPGSKEMKTALTPKNDDSELQAGSGGVMVRRSTCEAPRSPTLPSEIRRCGGYFDQLDSPRRPPALVARLMGLVDPPPPQPPSVAPSTAGSSLESAEEKRRKLLGALERCDEDLRALKRIIDAVRTTEILRWKAGGGYFDGRDLQAQEMMRSQLDANGEQQPSPVSVLDALCSPKSEIGEFSAIPHQDVEKKAWSSVEASCPLRRWMTVEGRIPRLPAAEKAFGAGDRWRRWRRSRGMVESVGEVEEEAVFGERSEFRGVGVELVDDVAEDLIDEFVMELVDCCCSSSKMSIQRLMRCKMKLCF